MKFLTMFVFFGFVLFCGVCRGQSPVHHISDMSIRDGDWIYRPVFTLAQDHAAARVDAIVAFRDPNTITGDNLSTILFARDAAPALSWNTKGWSGSQDQASIIKSIKTDYQILDCEDWIWDIKSDLEIQQAVSAGGSEPVEKGLLTSDPLSNVIPLGSIRELAVQLLSGIGYKAADVPIEQTGDPSTIRRDYTLNRMSRGIETYMTSPGTDEQRELAGFAAYTAPITPPGDAPDPSIVPGYSNPCQQTWTWPAISYGESYCGDWTTHEIGITEPGNVPLRTCYVRNCQQLQRSTVMTQNNCATPPTVTVSYLYRTVGYTEGCCVEGMGGSPPPIPCTPRKEDIDTPTPWIPTIPSIPGTDPSHTPVWPVLRPRCPATK